MIDDDDVISEIVNRDLALQQQQQQQQVDAIIPYSPATDEGDVIDIKRGFPRNKWDDIELEERGGSGIRSLS